MSALTTPSFDDTADFEDANRGFIAALEPCIIKNEEGRIVWNNEEYNFLKNPCPPTVIPSLWRQAQLCAKQGLFQVTEGIYQIRGFDLSNMTIIEGDKGVIVIEVHRDWAPLGADRFYNLVKNGFYDGCRFFRVLDGFMAQVGMNGDPSIQRVWGNANFRDDPVKGSNKRGYVTFAKASAPNSRSTQFFINYGDNSRLDGDGFAPFGQVVTGMDLVDMLYKGYGSSNVPDQGRITAEGNAYLMKEYPKLDFIKKATIEK